MESGTAERKIRISWLLVNYFLFFIIVLFSATCFGEENNKSKSLTFGVLPYLVPSHMLSTFGSASASLSQQTGIPVNFRTASDYVKFIENLKSLKYDLAIIQPFDVQLAVKTLGYIPIAQVNEPLDIVFVAKQSSQIRNLGDLKGKTVAMAPKTAATSIVAIAELENRGYEINKTINVKFVKSHDACLHEVVLNQAAACATGAPPVVAFEKRTDTSFNIFYRSEPIPHMAFVVHPRVPEAQREQIKQAVLSWNTTTKGQQILQQMNFPGWKSGSYQDYEVLEKFSSIDINAPKRTDDSLIFATFPYLPPKRLVEVLAPMSIRFSQIIGRQVHFRTSLSFPKFRNNISEKQYDIIMINPFDYEIAIQNGYKPIAQMQEKISAIFYTKKDSNIHKLQDLKGKTIATPQYEAAVTQLASRHLSQNGFVIGEDITINYRKSHDSCMEQLFQEHVSVCATSSIVVDKILIEVKSQELRQIAESEKIPGLVIMAHKRLSNADFEKIKKDVLSWTDNEAGRKLLEDSRLPAFGAVNPADFASLTFQ